MRTRFLKTTKLPVPKPMPAPKAVRVKVTPVKPTPEDTLLGQFATQPEVPPPNPKNLTKKLKSYL
jgi:hypothetical protein